MVLTRTGRGFSPFSVAFPRRPFSTLHTAIMNFSAVFSNQHTEQDTAFAADRKQAYSAPLYAVPQSTKKRTDAVPPSQVASEMIADALFLALRIAQFQHSDDAEKERFYRNRIVPMEIPVAFARRSALVNEPSLLPHDQRVSLQFDAAELISDVPAYSVPRGVSCLIPPDLRASSYEVRYLSMLEMAALACGTLTRFTTPNDCLGKDEQEAREAFEEDTFQHAADATYGGTEQVQRWLSRTVDQFRTEMHEQRLGRVMLPHDERLEVLSIVAKCYGNELQDMGFVDQQRALKKRGQRRGDVAHQFSDGRCRVFWTEIYADAQQDIDPDRVRDETKYRDRHYGTRLRFAFQYLAMRTLERRSAAAMTARRKLEVPAYLFARQYDVGSGAGQKQPVADVEALRLALATRLDAALSAFDAPIRNERDMLELFGSKRTLLERFVELCAQTRDIFADHTTNARATGAAMLSGLHHMMDEMVYFKRDWRAKVAALPEDVRNWFCKINIKEMRANQHLLAFVAHGNSNYNEWRYDAHRDDPRDYDNDNAYGFHVSEPSHTAFRFYQLHLRRALHEASSEHLPLVPRVGGSADEQRRRHDDNDADGSDDERHDRLHAFERVLREALADPVAVTQQASDVGGATSKRKVHREFCESASLRAAPAGKEPTSYGAAQYRDPLLGRWRGSLLTFAFEPTKSYDMSLNNEYGQLFSPSTRDLQCNGQFQFFNDVLGFVAREIHVAAFVAAPPDDVLRFVDGPLLRALQRRLDDEQADRARTFNQLCDAWPLMRNAAEALQMAWGEVRVFLERGAPVNRVTHDGNALKCELRPFSTLYDYGVQAALTHQYASALQQPPRQQSQPMPREERANDALQTPAPSGRVGGQSTTAVLSAATETQTVASEATTPAANDSAADDDIECDVAIDTQQDDIECDAAIDTQQDDQEAPTDLEVFCDAETMYADDNTIGACDVPSSLFVEPASAQPTMQEEHQVAVVHATQKQHAAVYGPLDEVNGRSVVDLFKVSNEATLDDSGALMMPLDDEKDELLPKRRLPRRVTLLQRPRRGQKSEKAAPESLRAVAKSRARSNTTSKVGAKDGDEPLSLRAQFENIWKKTPSTTTSRRGRKRKSTKEARGVQPAATEEGAATTATAEFVCASTDKSAE